MGPPPPPPPPCSSMSVLFALKPIKGSEGVGSRHNRNTENSVRSGFFLAFALGLSSAEAFSRCWLVAALGFEPSGFHILRRDEPAVPLPPAPWSGAPAPPPPPPPAPPGKKPLCLATSVTLPSAPVLARSKGSSAGT